MSESALLQQTWSIVLKFSVSTRKLIYVFVLACVRFDLIAVLLTVYYGTAKMRLKGLWLPQCRMDLFRDLKACITIQDLKHLLTFNGKVYV